MYIKTLDELKNKKFTTIYVDPPWRYSNSGTRGAAKNHYPCMTIEELKDLPVNDLADDNSHLHLWTTKDFIFDAKDLLDCWGFKYKSMLIWTKPQMGMGNYWRVSHEILLFGMKGKLPFQVRNKKSWIEHPRMKHSQKPDVVREMIEEVSPGPYLELFGRKDIENWTVFGNEIL